MSGDGKRVSVVAGTGKQGSKLVERKPLATELAHPFGVVVAGDGSVLITDQLNHRVLRVDGDGKRVSVVAGTGWLGSSLVDGDPLATELNYPRGVAVSRDGLVLINDMRNHRVLRVSWGHVDPAGSPWESGSQRQEGFPVPSAPPQSRPPSPVLNSGLYPSLKGSSQARPQPDVPVQQVLPAAKLQVSVVAGTGQRGITGVGGNPNPLATQLSNPNGICVSRNGSVLIADTSNHRVLQVSGDGRRVSVVAGIGQNGSKLVEGNPAQTQLHQPHGVAVAGDGSVLIADTSNHRVLQVSGDGRRVSVVAGIGQNGSKLVEGNPAQTQLHQPYAVAVAGDGSVLIADTSNHRVLRVSGDGRLVSVVVGTGQQGSKLVEGSPLATQFNAPYCVAVAGDGSLLVTDSGNHRVLRVSGGGNRVSVFAGTGSKLVEDNPVATQVEYPVVVAVAGDGSVLITGARKHRVLRVSSDGGQISVFAGTGQTGSKLVEGNPLATQLNGLRGIAIAGDGSVLIADTWNNRVLRVSGGYVGRGGFPWGLGPRQEEGFPVPSAPPQSRPPSPVLNSGLSPSLKGSPQSRPQPDTTDRQILPALKSRVSVVAGTGRSGSALVEDDPAATELAAPYGVAGDGSGFITDTYNDRVLRVSGDGRRVTRVIGNRPEG